MSNEYDGVAMEISPANKEKCERCGDLYYHPKTLIESEKQRAAEWEDIAVQRDSEITRLKELLAKAERALELVGNAASCMDSNPAKNCYYVAKAALAKIKGLENK